ncbi:MAG: transposase family protein [Nitrososphaeraceae archaeon]
MCRDIARLEPLIKRCIPLPTKKLYKHARRFRTIDEVEQYFPGFKAFIDSTEQEIPKPMNKRKRKSYYSGKKKKHTVKTQYMVNTKGLILHKTGYIRKVGNMIMIFTNTNHPVTPPSQVENIFDLGYLGVEKDFPTVKSVLPIRKRRNNMLSYEETTYNKKHSQLRIIIEHTICKLKKFGIMGTRFQKQSNKVRSCIRYCCIRFTQLQNHEI